MAVLTIVESQFGGWIIYADGKPFIGPYQWHGEALAAARKFAPLARARVEA